MPEEINDELKQKIAEKYAELEKQSTIEKASKELGVSPDTFNKYKKYKTEVVKEEYTTPQKEESDFEEDFEEEDAPDIEEEDDDEIIVSIE